MTVSTARMLARGRLREASTAHTTAMARSERAKARRKGKDDPALWAAEQRACKALERAAIRYANEIAEAALA